MPFSPQPRKKGVLKVPQDGSKDPSCGHTSSAKGCPACAAEIVDLPTEKMKITRLREKISDRTANDRRFSEKAALVLSEWINRKKR